MRKFITGLLLVCLSMTGHPGRAQSPDSLSENMGALPGKFFSKMEKRYASIGASLDRKTAKYLQRFERQEKRMRAKMHGADTSRAGEENIDSAYNSFREGLTTEENKLAGATQKISLNQYSGYIDSLGTSLDFLQQYKSMAGKIKLPAETLNKLKSKFNQTQAVQEFIAQRQRRLKDALSEYTHLPASLKNKYEQIARTSYYYQATAKEYRDMLRDPQKIEKAAMGLLSKMPAFQKFMQANSQLASLFRVPDNSASASAASLAGLQTRSSVQELIQQRISSGGPNALSQLRANLSAAQAEMTSLKDKISRLGEGGSGDLEMPGTKINHQKTHSFFGRLEYTANVQFEKSTSLLPTAALIGIGAGYRIDDTRTIGVGVDYSLGMGTIQHISFSSLGVGARSYVDWKIKNQLYFSGGYELHYNSAFKNITELKNYDAWTKSALAGLSKKYKINKKLKGNVQVLYDFLAESGNPKGQKILFRVGYSF